MTEKYTNNGTTTLNGSILSGATTLVVTDATQFPTGGNFRIVIDNEIMLVTAVSGTTFTVSRAAEGTTAVSHSNGATVTEILTAGSLFQIIEDNNHFATCEGRLTLASGTPVTVTDQTAKTTVYFTPFNGSRIMMFDGTSWQMVSFSEVSVAVPSTTVTPFDVFATMSGSTIVLSTVNWTNDTTRATSLSTQDGILVQTGDATKRYLGTGRTTGSSGQCEDSKANRLLWNMYNRRRRKLYVFDSTSSWTYASSTWRAADNTTTNHQLQVLVGRQEEAIDLRIAIRTSPAGAVGIGIGVTNANNADSSFLGPGSADGQRESTLIDYPAVGLTQYNWVESSAVGTSTYYANNGGYDIAAFIGTMWS